MRFLTWQRRLERDGSIRLDARWTAANRVIIAAGGSAAGLSIFAPWLFLLAIPVVAIAFFATKRHIVFDAGRRELRITHDRVLNERDRTISFAEVRDVEVMAGNPFWSLRVNGDELTALANLYANKQLQGEIGALLAAGR